MNKISKKTSLTKKVFNKVGKGELKMKSKLYFVLRAILFSLITVLIFLFILFFVSFIIFSLRISGVWFLPSFGFQVTGIFLTSLPWILILVAMALIIVLEFFVKKFSFAYRRPILYSVLAIIILTASGSFVIAKTQMHSDFFWKAQERKLPMAGGFYRGLEKSKLSQVHKGVVFKMLVEGFSLETTKGEVLTVIIMPNKKISLEEINKDDRVLVLGKRENKTIEAFGVRIVNCHDCQFDFFQKKNHMPMHLNR